MARTPGSINHRSGLIRLKLEHKLGMSLPEAMMIIADNNGDVQIKLDIYKALLPYCYPKLMSTEVVLSDEDSQGNAELEAALQEIQRLRESK